MMVVFKRIISVVFLLVSYSNYAEAAKAGALCMPADQLKSNSVTIMNDSGIYTEATFDGPTSPVPVGTLFRLPPIGDLVKCKLGVDGGSVNRIDFQGGYIGKTTSDIGGVTWSFMNINPSTMGGCDYLTTDECNSPRYVQIDANSSSAQVIFNSPGVYPPGSLKYGNGPSDKIKVRIDSANDGWIKLTYLASNKNTITVVEPTCAFDVNNVTVNLAEYSNETVKQSIPLTAKCYSLSSLSNLQFKITGSANSGGTIFTNTYSGSNAASGVGFKLWDKNNNNIKNGVFVQYPNLATNQVTDLGLQVSYAKTSSNGKIKAGNVQAALTIVVDIY